MVAYKQWYFNCLPSKATLAIFAGLSVSYSNKNTNRSEKTSYCQEIHVPTNSKNKVRILIVGSGLTGSLTALRIRQRLETYQNKSNIEIEVAERATYPAGRFGAIANHQSCIADIGAQVLSTVNPHDPRAMGGHGINIQDIKLSYYIAQGLLSSGLLRPASNESLGCTDERMLWEDLWLHYFPTKSMKSVLENILREAKVQPNFGVRIDSIQECDSEHKKMQVKGISRVPFPNLKEIREEPFVGFYDCVVFCIPSPDTCAISGVLNMLDEKSRMVLQNVGYDQRTCEAHFFSPKLLPFLRKAFGSSIEISVGENEIDSKGESAIEYISLQNVKRSSPIDSPKNEHEICSVVLHSKAGHLLSKEESTASLDKELSKLTGLSESQISSYRLNSRSICWETSQMIRPMESIISDPPFGWQCLRNSNGSLVLAGDYMTQSSFLGCVATADAAARTVLNTIFE